MLRNQRARVYLHYYTFKQMHLMHLFECVTSYTCETFNVLMKDIKD